MKMTTASGTIGLAALAALASPFTQAQESGWYGGANIGRSAATIDDARITSGLLSGGLSTSSIADRDRDTGYKVFGGYQFNRNFAVEGGFFDLGTFGFTATTVPAGTLSGDIRLKGVNLDVLGIVPLTDRFSAFGRVGLNHARARDSFTTTGAVRFPYANATPSKSDTNYKFGAGLMYDFTKSLAMRVEAERYRIDDAVGNKGHVDLFSVGLIYRFGAKPPPPPARVAAPAPVVVAAAPEPPPPPPAPPPPPSPPAPPPAPMKVTFSADALFDFDRSVLKPAGRQALDKLAADIRDTRYDTVSVTGHTDRLGPNDYNLKLSARRANAVSAYLVESGGVPAGKISAKGVDGANPVTKPGECKGNKPTKQLVACLQPDRRVEVEVTGTR